MTIIARNINHTHANIINKKRQYWKNASHCEENSLKSLLALISGGSFFQSEVHKKLKDFWPIEVRKEGKFSCEAVEARVKRCKVNKENIS